MVAVEVGEADGFDLIEADVGLGEASGGGSWAEAQVDEDGLIGESQDGGVSA